MKKFFFFIFILFVFMLSACSLNLNNKVSNEVKPDLTVYAIICLNPNATLDNCSNRYSGGRENFIVNIDNQQVIAWSPDVSPVEYLTIKNCSIVNINNWTCTYDDDSATFGFNKGLYFTKSSTILTASTILYVQKNEWEKNK